MTDSDSKKAPRSQRFVFFQVDLSDVNPDDANLFRNEVKLLIKLKDKPRIIKVKVIPMFSLFSSTFVPTRGSSSVISESRKAKADFLSTQLNYFSLERAQC